MGYPWPTYLPIFSGAQEASWDPSELTSLIDEWDAASGCVTDGAASFVSGSIQYLNIASDASLQMGDNHFVIWGWFNVTDVTGTRRIIGKWNSAGNYEYLLEVNVAGPSLDWNVRKNDDSGSYKATHGTTPLVATDYFFVAYHDPDTNLIGVSMNGGAFVTTAATGGTHTGSDAFGIGSSGTAVAPFWGTIQACGKLKGRQLTAGEITSLYNAGSGVAYADIPASIKAESASALSMWNLHEASGARVDSHGSNDLTAVNAPGVAAGVAEGAAVNNSPVKQQTGVWNSTVRSQATMSSQPLWIANSGDPYLDFTFAAAGLSMTASDASTSWSYSMRADFQEVNAAERFLMDSETGRFILCHTINAGSNAGIYDGAYRSAGAVATTGDQVLVFVLDGAGTSGAVYRDGTIVGSAFTYTPKAIGGTTMFGGQYTGPATRAVLMKSFRDVLVASALTDDERASLDSYMGV